MLPAIFVSHGAPTLALDASPAREFLKELGGKVPKPRAILAISAHWETSSPSVNSVATNSTIHDFYGFPEALYRIEYPAPGSPALAERTRALLAEAGFEATTDRERGLDHGAWVPLMLMYPEADVPVVQLSIQTERGPEHQLRIGQALAPLREADVLVVGSGSMTHNLCTMARGQVGAPEAPWARDFAEWIHGTLTAGRVGDLLDYRRLAPHGAFAHPTEDHFLPLVAALGAGGEPPHAERLHASTTFGTLRMDAYAFS
ncbi:MAG TPA: class III extradiol ring-cleavage dioxygenase [Micropepsaceae bacterium]|nr:class III extradiol ring-cleavage dioxygenase [Micropepsaceae bacterium]